MFTNILNFRKLEKDEEVDKLMLMVGGDGDDNSNHNNNNNNNVL